MTRALADNPHASRLVISAEIQGPDEAQLREQVEDLVGSFAFIMPD